MKYQAKWIPVGTTVSDLKGLPVEGSSPADKHPVLFENESAATRRSMDLYDHRFNKVPKSRKRKKEFFVAEVDGRGRYTGEVLEYSTPIIKRHIKGTK